MTPAAPLPPLAEARPARELVLHGAPMLLLDTVVEANAECCRARLTVDAGAWYAQTDGAMPAWFGVELMAQTIAAFSGNRRKGLDRPLVMGYLLGTTTYVATVPSFPAGEVLEIEARLHFWDEQSLSAFRCGIALGGVQIASAILKVLEEA